MGQEELAADDSPMPAFTSSESEIGVLNPGISAHEIMTILGLLGLLIQKFLY